MSTKKDLARVTADAVDVIGDIATTGMALPLPAEVKAPLAVIIAITKAVQAGLARELRPDQVAAEIEKAIGDMNADIAKNRLADKAELDAAFGPPGSPGVGMIAERDQVPETPEPETPPDAPTE